MEEAKQSVPRYYTVPRLAARLGVTSASVREWIARGQIEEPPRMPVTGERAYPAEAADKIAEWYTERVRQGKTRGPGAAERRQRAVSQQSATEDASR